MIYIKSPIEIEEMRNAGQMAAETLLLVEEKLKPGITGKDIEKIVKEDTDRKNAICAPFMYIGNNPNQKPFPGYCCISVHTDYEIVHGVPRNKSLNNCIVNVDITTINKNGWHGDCNKTFIIGQVSEELKRLVQTTKMALEAGISEVKPGNRLGDIGEVIQKYAESNGYFICKQFTGHGIGKRFHEDFCVPAFGVKGTGIRLIEGMTFTIEPILCTVEPEIEIDNKNQWTVYMANKGFSAQFEKTLAVTKDGYEILTKW